MATTEDYSRNSVVNAGVEGERACECGRVWLLSKRSVPQRDKDDISCTCGQVLVSWNGGCVWKTKLVLDAPQIGETVRYCVPHNNAQLARIVGFTGNSTDVRIRIAGGGEDLVAPWGIVERIKTGK
jgi:hypothetical protein